MARPLSPLQRAQLGVAQGLALPKCLEGLVEPPTAREYHADRANRGQGLERALTGQHGVYQQERRAVIVQQFPKVVSRGRSAGAAEGAALFAQATPRVADYMGALGDGRAVALEAKESHGGKLPLSAVTDGQRDFMRRWPGLGALVVRIYDGTRLVATWAVPFSAYLHAWDLALPVAGQRRAKGTASLTPGQLDGLGVRVSGTDWLGAVIGGALNFSAGAARRSTGPTGPKE